MITVFSKLRCPKCDEVKDYLEREGHVFKSVDITNDLIKLTEFRTTYVGAGFPVVEISSGKDLMTIAGDVNAIKEAVNNLK